MRQTTCVLVRWASIVVVTAGIGAGVLHLPGARSLLRRAGGCPIPRATAAQVEAAQARAFRVLRGTATAKSRPALGFGLEISTRTDVESWARKHRIACESRREGAILLCDAVPASAVSPGATGRYDELAFGFRLRDFRLVNLTALRTGLSPRAADGELRSVAARLGNMLGAPAKAVAGDPAVLVYRHADYLAEVSAMSLRGRGHALREHYMSALE